MSGGPEGHSSPNLPKAQAIKDATMANSILNCRQNEDLFIHFNGSYHSDHHQGILWYLNKYNHDIKTVTIATVIQDDIARMNDENKGLADFVIVIPTLMTKTYK
jgi:uncharacterized iron-regulated protein